MFKVTKKEENAVTRIQGIYTSLQFATDKVARSLLFDHNASLAPRKSIFGFGSGHSQKDTIPKEKIKLLEVLTILKSEVEACLPTIVGDHLFFKCRLVDENECDIDRFRISEAQNTYDMIACFEELERRISKMLAFPEIAEVVQNPSSYAYCTSLAIPNLGISCLSQTYLKELKSEEAAKLNASDIQNPNISRRKKKARRSKRKKSGNKR